MGKGGCHQPHPRCRGYAGLMQKVYKDDAGQLEKTPKLTIPEWQKLLMEILEKDGGLDMLKDWPEKEAMDARRMLMEFHHVFSLDKNEMGCTDATEHFIKLTKSEPFKERFCQLVCFPCKFIIRDSTKSV